VARAELRAATYAPKPHRRACMSTSRRIDGASDVELGLGYLLPVVASSVKTQ
jgi:hypothetical protein